MRDYLQAQGHQAIHGSRDATRKAFNLEIIKDAGVWMDMIKDRNQISHSYNQDTATRISKNIRERFSPCL